MDVKKKEKGSKAMKKGENESKEKEDCMGSRDVGKDEWIKNRQKDRKEVIKVKERVKEEGNVCFYWNWVKKAGSNTSLCSVPRARLPRAHYWLQIEDFIDLSVQEHNRNTLWWTVLSHGHRCSAQSASTQAQSSSNSNGWGGHEVGGRESPEPQGVEDSLSLCALTQQISSQRSYCEPSRAHQSSASVLLRKTRDVGLKRCTQNISKFMLLQVELQMKAPKPAVPLTASRSNSACVAESSRVL